MIALAILAGTLAIAGVIYVLGDRYLKLQQSEMEPEVDPDESPEQRTTRLIREGPKRQRELDLAAWREEKKAEGLSDKEIDDLLDNREPVLFI